MTAISDFLTENGIVNRLGIEGANSVIKVEGRDAIMLLFSKFILELEEF